MIVIIFCNLYCCQVRKESILMACNLIYPPSSDSHSEWSFCDLLGFSLCPQQTTPAWCDSCDKFSPTSQARLLNSLPKILVINTAVHNGQYKEFWENQINNFVAKAVSVTSDSGNRSMAPSPATIQATQGEEFFQLFPRKIC